jgi:hypothetical protein
MEHYLGVAKAEGVTEDEIGTIQSIVMSLAACRVRSQFQEVRDRQETSDA